ncbi:MAG: hypothetical protein P1U89_11250 [Verrucomicrobiales bacterium]|nr:hypothetical protein [Verrucomicrobiales bacterium]
MIALKNSDFGRKKPNGTLYRLRVNRVRSKTAPGTTLRIPEKSLSGQACVIILSLLLVLSTIHAQQPVTATVHRNDGLVRSVQIRTANNNGIMWTGRGAPNPEFMPHDEIAYVDFAEPDLWEEANNDYYQGDYTKAIAAFSSIANNAYAHFHPTPGNYASLARLRLIECYRETGNAKAIVETAAKLQGGSLPKAYRARMEVVEAWAELGKGKWNEALQKAESISANPIAPDRNDLGFIKAIALEKTGKTNEAIIAYGTAFTVDFGGSRLLAKRALQNAILLLINQNNPDRETELHSLVHTYAKVYNKGSLWDGAPAKAVELLERKLDLPEIKAKPKEKPAAAESETAAEPKRPEKPDANAPGKSKTKGKAKVPRKGNTKGAPKGGKAANKPK